MTPFGLQYIAPGFELYSGFDKIGDHNFSEGDHRAGPVVYGSLGPLNYESGILLGLSDGAPDGTLKLLVSHRW